MAWMWLTLLLGLWVAVLIRFQDDGHGIFLTYNVGNETGAAGTIVLLPCEGAPAAVCITFEL